MGISYMTSGQPMDSGISPIGSNMCSMGIDLFTHGTITHAYLSAHGHRHRSHGITITSHGQYGVTHGIYVLPMGLS